MATITTRAAKGSALTHNEVDANFLNINASLENYDSAFQIAGNVLTFSDGVQFKDVAAPTKIGQFSFAGITAGTTVVYTFPNVTGALASLGNISQTFTGSVSIVPATNGSAITIGAIPQTGTITLGRSTAAQTVDIAVGATAAATTKTVNIGTTGVSTSVTNINSGSAVTGALVTHIWNAGANSMRFDSSGNLGLGVTPSAWISAFKAMEFAAAGSVSAISDELGVNANSVYLTSTNWTYKATGFASQYRQSSGQHKWFTAPSGTAGNAITFTQAMTLDASGNLLVGQTASGLQNGTGTAIQAATTIFNHVNGQASGTSYTIFGYNATSIGSISQNGTTGVLYNTTSDYRLKRNQKPLSGSGKFIDALKPTAWEWSRDGRKDAGFIAHEFQEVCPNAVNGTKDEMEVQVYEVSPAIAAVTEQREVTPAVYDGEVLVTPATYETIEVAPAIPAVMGERTVPKYQSMQASSSEVMANIIAELQSLRTRVAHLEAA